MVVEREFGVFVVGKIEIVFDVGIVFIIDVLIAVCIIFIISVIVMKTGIVICSEEAFMGCFVRSLLPVVEEKVD